MYLPESKFKKLFRLKTDYQEIVIYPEYTQFRWLPTTENMDKDEFIQEIYIAAKFIETHKPERILLNTKELRYLITVNIKDELNEIFLPVYNKGVKKLAVVLPDDALLQNGIEYAIDAEKWNHNFKYRYFKDVEQAINWLKL